jgi:glycosyltransferase involved in cell wall biosynthesis
MGGMERQLLSIATGLLDRGHEVTIISLDESAARPFFDSDPRLQFVGLSIGDSATKATFTERYQRQMKVYRLFKDLKIEIALSFMTGSYWFSVLPARMAGMPIILAERNGPSIYSRTRVRRFRSIIFASMLLASAITVQFESYRNSYPFFLRKRIIAIPNKIPKIDVKSRSESDPFIFLFAGRLSNQKQIVELVLAFLEFNKKHSNTKLEIYGEGEQREKIEGIVKDNLAEDIIRIHPATKNIERVFSTANVMIAPSLWEGFPNSVAEALAASLPVGGFSDCEGVRDLITPGGNGWLIDRSDPIISQIELLEQIYLSRDELGLYSAEAKISMATYQGEEPNEQWDHLIKNLVRK